MLTAAICGDVFASPPVDSILAVSLQNGIFYLSFFSVFHLDDKLLHDSREFEL